MNSVRCRNRTRSTCKMVGKVRFELTVSCSQGKRVTRLRYSPINWVRGRRLNPFLKVMSLLSYHILYPAINLSWCRPEDQRNCNGEVFRLPRTSANNINGQNRTRKWWRLDESNVFISLFRRTLELPH